MYIHSQVISTECSDSQNFVFNWGGGGLSPLLNYLAYLMHSFFAKMNDHLPIWGKLCGLWTLACFVDIDEFEF